MPTLRTPPLLLGAALLFWGWETGFALPAAVLAILIEAPALFRRQWELQDITFRRIWDISGSLVLLLALLSLVSDYLTPLARLLQTLNPNTQAPAPESLLAIYALNQILPLLLAPILVAQRYSTRDQLPADVFLWLLRNRRLQPGYTPPLINPGFPYFILCLTAAGAANQRTIAFYAGVSLLAIWSLWTARPRRFRLPWFLIPVAVAIAIGYATQSYLNRLQDFVETGMAQMLASAFSGNKQDSTTTSTGLGTVGRMKLRGGIVMRINIPDGKPPPPLLRSASFDRFATRTWSISNRAANKIQPASDNDTHWTLAAGQPGAATVEIETRFPSAERLLYLPGGAARIENLTATELTRNSFGATKGGDGPRYANYRVRYDPIGNEDTPPTPQDFQIPDHERGAVTSTLARLNLPENAPTEAVLEAVASLFEEHFAYSTYHAADDDEAQGRVTPLANFLLRTHAGHCEYFAAATTLLLRKAGIPARYAIGYSVQEQNRQKTGYIVRSRHAHAWCLFYANGRWQDFDTTPSRWINMENADASAGEPWADQWEALRFRLSAWLTAHPLSKTALPWALVALTVFLVWRRLTRKSTTRRTATTRLAANARKASTAIRESPFHRVEARLAELGYARPQAEPAALWLRRIRPHLPLTPNDCDALLALHYRDRFDPDGLSAADATALQSHVSACLTKLASR